MLVRFMSTTPAMTAAMKMNRATTAFMTDVAVWKSLRKASEAV